ncbi:MAG: GTP-binding protein [Spirochaeta sp.]|nr:GTP-binding protein [Spirochaeta sp.]
MRKIKSPGSLIEEPLPITLVTGFLGSGKSTYINRILQAYSGRRIGLVVNEFGEVGLEANILEASTDDIVELSGGCMCCLLRKDLREAVRRLLRNDAGLERIIVEASGLSDPVPVQQTFENARFGRPVQLESVICMVDQVSFLEHRVDFEILDHQVRTADFVLITKSEQSPESAALLEEVLGELAPQVPKFHVGEEPPLALLVGVDTSFGVDTTSGNRQEYKHESGVQQLWFESMYPFDPERLKKFFSELPPGVVRGKGVLYLANKDGKKHKFVLQLSGARRELQAVPWKRGEVKSNVVLLIGKNFEPQQLREKLDTCLTEPGVDLVARNWKRA